MVQKIISYNVNGIRAAMRKGFADWLNDEKPQIVCLQETKVQEGQVDTSPFEQLGYHHYWHYAKKKGYSGVALFTAHEPDYLEMGMGHNKYDDEGRVIRADFNDITIVCVYIPSGTTGDVRQDFKMEFLDDFYRYIQQLKQSRPKLIVSGDYNICHKPIDINHPERHQRSSGFLPEERAWMDKFTANGFVDSFRRFNQEPENYSWWSYRANARAKNLGWRIDYHMVTTVMDNALKNAGILQNVYHSDHCPVKVEVDFK